MINKCINNAITGHSMTEKISKGWREYGLAAIFFKHFAVNVNELCFINIIYVV